MQSKVQHQMNTNKFYQILSVTTALMFVSYFSFSQTIFFNNNSGDHKWETASNWSDGNVPGPSTNILFTGVNVTEACHKP